MIKAAAKAFRRTAIKKARNKEHEELVEKLSDKSRLLPVLLTEFGSDKPVIYDVYREEEVIGILNEEDTFSPDLVVFYSDRKFHGCRLLIVEAKARNSFNSLCHLENRLLITGGCINTDGSLSIDFQQFLDKHKVPREVSRTCRVDFAGVYGTRSGGFRIYNRKILREPGNYAVAELQKS